jgi:putative ABC transport system permease protein
MLDRGLIEEWPVPNAAQILADAGYTVVIVNLLDDLVRDIRPALIMLWVGVAFVLLIGCLNIANLMLARSNVRLREMAIRIAVGADRARLSRQLLTEAVLVAALGGLLGLGVAAGGLSLLESLGIEDLPRGAQVGIDGTVVLFTLSIAVAAGVLFGLIPLVHMFRSDLSSVFRSESRTGSASRGTVTVRSALVMGQVAIAFILLIGAGLMFASMRAVLNEDPGFQPENVLTGFVSLPNSRYEEDDARRQFLDEMLFEVRALPGVTAASIVTNLPFSGSNSSSVITPEGYVPTPGESLLAPFSNVVGPDYFETMGIPLLSGRTFDETDTEESGNVIILDAWLANRYFPNESPLGKRMLYGSVPGMEDADDEENLYTIIGVVAEIKHNDLTATDQVGAYYFTYKQQTPNFVTLTARTAMEPTAAPSSIRNVVSGIDPDLPFYLPETMEERVADSLVTRRTPMLLLMTFAAVALFLAAVGIYGVLAYTVAQRTRELGIRMALGSSPEQVYRLVIRQGVKVVGLGVAIGILGSLGLVQLIQALLYGVRPTDPGVLVSVALLLAAVGIGACALPARRATRIDPVVALSSD